VFNYDEWGGFYEHVPPPAAPIPPADAAAGNADGLRGFRVPCLLVSPWARRGFVAKDLFDHTSILRMIEDRWALPPLTVRDASAGSLAGVLGRRADTAAPQYDVPAGPFAGACLPEPPGTPASTEAEWSELRDVAAGAGWPV
jgi:phospholipase C